jgi:hypothetical protein
MHPLTPISPANRQSGILPVFLLAMTLALAAAVCLLCLRTAVAQVSCDESVQYMHAVVSAVGAHACVFGVAFSRVHPLFALNPWSFKCGEPPRTRTSASSIMHVYVCGFSGKDDR